MTSTNADMSKTTEEMVTFMKKVKSVFLYCSGLQSVLVGCNSSKRHFETQPIPQLITSHLMELLLPASEWC